LIEKENAMNRKIILPILALALATMACLVQVTPTLPPVPTSLPPTDTPIPPTPTATPVTPTPTALTLDMLKNGTYYDPYANRTVKLVNGAYSEGSGADQYSVQMLDTVAFGNLDSDGITDAAVILVENTGGTGEFESVVAILNKNGAPSQAGQAELGDRVKVNAMSINASKVELDMLVQGPNDPMCCPSLFESQSYEVVEKALWLTSLSTLTSDGQQKRFISINTPPDYSSVTNPFTITGNETIAPFENTLTYRVFLADGTKVNESTLIEDSNGVAGGPGTFSQQIDLGNAGVTGPIIIQFLDLSPADGSTQALGAVVLTVK
jgi:Immunoglobulin-like domain of bacterial spore germination